MFSQTILNPSMNSHHSRIQRLSSLASAWISASAKPNEPLEGPPHSAWRPPSKADPSPNRSWWPTWRDAEWSASSCCPARRFRTAPGVLRSCTPWRRQDKRTTGRWCGANIRLWPNSDERGTPEKPIRLAYYGRWEKIWPCHDEQTWWGQRWAEEGCGT